MKHCTFCKRSSKGPVCNDTKCKRRWIKKVKPYIARKAKKQISIAIAASDSNSNLVEAAMNNGVGAAIKEFAEAKARFEQAKANLIKAIN